MGGSSLGVTCSGLTAAVVFMAILHKGVMVEDFRILSLNVPKYAKRYTNQTLNCIVDKPEMIKWYLNDIEFLRYYPSTTPIYYDNDNVSVIMEETTGPEVVLKEVDLNASGTYMCFVSNGFPKMVEDRKRSTMTVVVMPEERPSIEGDVADHYAVGDRVNLNCTATPSVPAASLVWIINENPAPADYIQEYPLEDHPDGLVVSRLGLNFILTTDHFIDGELKLKCTATIASSLQSVEHSQQNPTKSRPVLITPIAPLTSGAPSLLGRCSMFVPHLLFLILTSIHLLR